VAAERHFRAFARRAINLPATIGTLADGPRPARLIDLGLGGACVEVRAALKVGFAVTLEVTAPNLWDPLIVPAKVAWVHPGAQGVTRAGVAFDHAGKAALPALVELLASYRYE
jgi:PilZ domain